MPTPGSAGRRHPVFRKLADEIVVHLGHRVLVLLAGELVLEQGLLQERIVQLGVRVRQLHPPDEGNRNRSATAGLPGFRLVRGQIAAG